MPNLYGAGRLHHYLARIVIYCVRLERGTQPPFLQAPARLDSFAKGKTHAKRATFSRHSLGPSRNAVN